MRILASILVLVGAVDLILNVVEIAEIRLGSEFPYWDYTATAYNLVVIIGLICGLIWKYYEHNKEKLFDTLHDIAQKFIRIWLAFMIAGYGFAKILKTQFQVPEHIKDIPMGEQHPFWLTWNYFGFSREFSLMIAAVEIAGPVLLLFRKTRLLGASILFPAMVNILLINKYYYINPEAYRATIFFTMGLIYLLLLDYRRLKSCFLDVHLSMTQSSFGRALTKNILRLVIIASSYGLIWHYAHDSTPNTTFLKGVWSVESMKYNNDAFLYPNRRDSILSKLYFEYQNDGQAILEFNSHRNRSYTNYRLSEDEDSLSIRVNEKLMKFTVNRIERDVLRLEGTHLNDTLILNLKKIRETAR